MLAGYWRFTYQIINIWTDDYYLDITQVEESTTNPGQYYIFGENQYGILAVAGYDLGLGQHILLDSGTTIDQFYIFSFIGNGLVSGCYYQIDKSNNSWNSCYPMSGTLLALAKNVSAKNKLQFLSQEEKEAKLVQEISQIKSEAKDIKNLEKDQSLQESFERLKALYNERQQ